MKFSVVLPEWLDRPIAADLELALLADRLGYRQLWVPEMAKLDAPAMAAQVVAATSRIEPVLGPLAVTVRSPTQIALAAATVAATGRRTHVALGTSSSVVAHWHAVSRVGAASRLETHLDELRSLFDGQAVRGFRLREQIPHPTITVAAFGPRAIQTATRSDRMVLNMVTPGSAARLVPGEPSTAVWLAASLDPSPDEIAWLGRGFVAYLGAPGYSDMFIEAGFGELVAAARDGAQPKELARRIGPDLVGTVALIGSERDITDRIEQYASAGIAEIGVVPPALDLPSGRRTLELFA